MTIQHHTDDLYCLDTLYAVQLTQLTYAIRDQICEKWSSTHIQFTHLTDQKIKLHQKMHPKLKLNLLISMV